MNFKQLFNVKAFAEIFNAIVNEAENNPEMQNALNDLGKSVFSGKIPALPVHLLTQENEADEQTGSDLAPAKSAIENLFSMDFTRNIIGKMFDEAENNPKFREQIENIADSDIYKQMGLPNPMDESPQKAIENQSYDEYEEV
jgi:hypothetical protein